MTDKVANYIEKCTAALTRYVESKDFNPKKWRFTVPGPQDEAEAEGLKLWKAEIDAAVGFKTEIKTDD